MSFERSGILAKKNVGVFHTYKKVSNEVNQYKNTTSEDVSKRICHHAGFIMTQMLDIEITLIKVQ